MPPKIDVLLSIDHVVSVILGLAQALAADTVSLIEKETLAM